MVGDEGVGIEGVGNEGVPTGQLQNSYDGNRHRAAGARPTAMGKVANRDVRVSGGGSLTGPLRNTRDFPQHDGTSYRVATRTPLGSGVCPSFKGHSLSRRAKPYRYDSQLFHRCTAASRVRLDSAPGGSIRTAVDSVREMPNLEDPSLVSDWHSRVTRARLVLKPFPGLRADPSLRKKNFLHFDFQKRYVTTPPYTPS